MHVFNLHRGFATAYATSQIDSAVVLQGSLYTEFLLSIMLIGRKILITGVASKLSIANGIARAMHAQGAELAFTYQNDKLRERVLALAAQLDTPSERCFPLDVRDDTQIDALFTALGTQWTQLDGLVHAIAYTTPDQLEGDFTAVTTREGFALAHEISSYSFIALARAARALLASDAALLTLSYLGAQRTLPNYNVMGVAKASLEAATRYLAASLGTQGIRVNAISSGPIRTLAASGIKNFRAMLAYNAQQALLQRNVTIEEIGNAAAFLCSPLASGITAEVLYVDAGFNVAAMATGSPVN